MRALWIVLAALVLTACDQVSALTPAQKVSGDTKAVVVGEQARGAVLAQNLCMDCHGQDGVLAKGGAPFIAGLSQDYLVKSLLDYSQGGRQHVEMTKVVQSLDALQLADVTAYYAALKTPWQGAMVGAQSRAVLEDAAAREAAAHIVTGCKSCHRRASDQQKDQPIPSLDGMTLEYFLSALSAYADGQRQNDTMQMFKNRLSESERYRLGAYYAARQPQAPSVAKTGNPVRGKQLAQACVGCHGLDGNSLNPHMPNLAGQPAAYLSKALTDYRDGARHSALMEGAVQGLKARDIADIVAYFTRQKPQSALHVDLDTMHVFDVESDGRAAAAACDSCHGVTRKAGVPRLTGQSVDYLIQATLSYQQGARQHPAMGEVRAFYSDIEIEKAAYFYATRALNNDAPEIMPDAALVEACSACHGAAGISPDPEQVPNLAGQDVDYLLAASQAYASGERVHEGMQNAMAGLTREQLQAYANYFAALPAQTMTTFLPDPPAEVIAGRCAMCHGDNGYRDTAGVPRLAGQLESYMVKALTDYREHRRKHAGMEAMTDVLSLMEIKAVAAYYARQ